MTQTTATMAPTRRDDLRTPVVSAVLLSIVATIILIARNTDDGPVWRVGAVLGGLIIVMTAIVFGVVARRTLAKQSGASSARAALALGIVTVLSIVVFWTALPPVFAIGAFTLARDARDRRPFRREAMAPVAIGLAGVGLAAGLVLACVG